MTNLQQENFHARRVVKDYLASVGDISKVMHTKQLLSDVSASNCRYKDGVERKQKETELQKRRTQEENELSQCKKRCKTITKDIKHFEQRAFSISSEANSNSSTKQFKEAHVLNIQARDLKK